MLQGRARFQLYQKLLALAAAVIQAVGQLTYIRPFSVLITANIASALPASVGAAVQQAADKDASALPIYGLAFFLTTLGVVYVQEVWPASLKCRLPLVRAFVSKIVECHLCRRHAAVLLFIILSGTASISM